MERNNFFNFLLIIQFQLLHFHWFFITKERICSLFGYFISFLDAFDFSSKVFGSDQVQNPVMSWFTSDQIRNRSELEP